MPKTDHILYRLSFGNVVAGAEVCQGKVVHAAPILRRFIGRPWKELWHWVVYRKNGKVERLDAGTN